MNSLEVLKKFEALYDTIKPAQEYSNEAFAWFTGISHPLFNAVMHLSCDDVKAKVDTLIEKNLTDVPMSFWIHPGNRATGLADLLVERHFQPLISCPLMSWAVTPISASQCDIRPANMEIFHDILSTVYEFDWSIREAFKTLMDHSESENYLIYENGEPVGTGTLIVNGSFGGVFNDATLPQRREATESMMKFLMHRSYELNLKELVILSSPEAKELYEKLGFVNLFNVEIYGRFWRTLLM